MRLDDYRARVTGGAQCRYADGTKAVLIRTRDPHEMALVMPSWPEPLTPLHVDDAGEIRFEANGGVATYRSIRLAVEDLMSRPVTPVTGKTWAAFLSEPEVAACSRKAFDADLKDAY
ncbi:hypothetical protein [Phenylobacterium sp.]|uniref:hypothetical protein n=1 Tax=Phenylobacterium sp. TaxID=1871053 RepID=UPI00394ED907